MIQDKEGTFVEVKANGEKIIKKADGSVIEVHPSRTQTINNANGS